MRGFLRFLFWTGAIFGAIALLLHLLVFDEWVVPHGPDKMFETSVMPALMAEDKILIKRGTVPKLAELGRCKHPTDSGRFVVGRVFGEPGDKVEINDGSITTNGKRLAASHGCDPVTVAHPVTENLVTLNCGVAETGAWTFEYLSPQSESGQSAGASSAQVEAGKLYIVSDNRMMHEDSRDFGQVDASTCEHIVYRLWGEHYGDDRRRFTILW